MVILCLLTYNTLVILTDTKLIGRTAERAELCNVEMASPELGCKSNTLKPNQQEKRVTFYQCLHNI